MVLMIMFVPMDVYSSPIFLEEEQDRVLELINAERQDYGVEALVLHDKLIKSSVMKTTDMIEEQYFGHISPSGQSLKTYIDDVGYEYALAGENLAVGFYNARDVVEAWLSSPKHHENITEGIFIDTGLSVMAGEYQGRQTFYFANHFGSPRSSLPFAGENSSGIILGEKISSPGFYAQTKYYLAKNTDFEPIKNVFLAGDTLNLFFLILFGTVFDLDSCL
jgi:hypothetical protein